MTSAMNRHAQSTKVKIAPNRQDSRECDPPAHAERTGPATASPTGDLAPTHLTAEGERASHAAATMYKLGRTRSGAGGRD